MARCTNRRMRELQHAFELHLLSDDLRDEVEQHLLTCDACFQEVKERETVNRLLETDQDIRLLVESLGQEEEPSPVTVAGEPVRWRLWTPIAVAASILLLLVLKDWEIRPTAPAMATENSIVVLPFSDLRPEDDTLRTGEMVSNLLIAGLSRSSVLRVISGQYVHDLRRQSRAGVSDAEIASKAGARWLVRGTINRLGSEAIMTAQVIDVSSGEVAAAPVVKARETTMIFSMVDSLSRGIRAAVLNSTELSREPTGSVAEVTTASLNAYREYTLGLDMYRQMREYDAVAHFRKAVLHDSTFAMAYYYLSQLSPRPEAIAYIEKAAKLSDKLDVRDRMLIESQEALLSGDNKRSLAVLKTAVTKYRDEKTLWYRLALIEYGVEQLSSAIEHFGAAIALDSQYGEAYNMLAYSYNRAGDFDGAIRAIDRYIALSPNEPNPFDSRGELYALNGRLEEAAESYRKALSVNPSFEFSLTNLGFISIYQGDFRRADSCFEVLSQSEYPEVRLSGRINRAIIAAYRGRFADALSQLAVLKESSIAGWNAYTTADYFRLLAQIHEESGEIPLALKEAEMSATVRPLDFRDPSRDQAYLIKLLAMTGKVEEAEAIVGRIKQKADSAGAPLWSYYSASGSFALGRSMSDSALTLFKRCEESGHFRDRMQLGKLYLTAGRPADAASIFTAAGKSNSPRWLLWPVESALRHYYLGIAYEQSRSYPLAVKEYKTFIGLWNESDTPSDKLTDARRRLAALERLL